MLSEDLSVKDILAELAVYLNDIKIFEGKCDCKTLAHCRHYMKKNLAMSDEGIENICSYIEGFGGYCDCEVLMNVVPTVFPTDEDFDSYVDKAVSRMNSSERRN